MGDSSPIDARFQDYLDFSGDSLDTMLPSIESFTLADAPLLDDVAEPNNSVMTTDEGLDRDATITNDVVTSNHAITPVATPPATIMGHLEPVTSTQGAPSDAATISSNRSLMQQLLERLKALEENQQTTDSKIDSIISSMKELNETVLKCIKGANEDLKTSAQLIDDLNTVLKEMARKMQKLERDLQM